MLDAPAILFEAEGHTYSLDGVRVPSVTQILADVTMREYRMVRADVMARAAQLGSAVHSVIELDIRKDLDEDALDPALLPYLAQWRQFVARSGFVPLLSEAIVHSRKFGFAGKLDLFGVLHGRHAVIDAKRCASVPRSAGPQTAGYAIALAESHPNGVPIGAPLDRYALHLTPERWQLVPLRGRDDARVFLSALTLHQWSNAA